MHDNTPVGHVTPKSTIVGSYVALLVLTAVMVGISRLDVDAFSIDWLNLHALRTAVIMGAALIMGLIVSMFLMGLRYEHKLLNLTIFLSNFVFLLIFVLFTWVDTSFRGALDPMFTEKINWTSPVKPEAHEAHEATSAPSSLHDVPVGSEAPAAAQTAVPGDTVVHKAEDAEAKKKASGVAPANPAQATPEHPANPSKPAKDAGPKLAPPSPNPAKPAGAKDNTAAPKQAAPAKEAAPAAK